MGTTHMEIAEEARCGESLPVSAPRSREKLLLIIFFFAYIAVITVPHLYAAATPPANHVYGGWLVLANDQNVYLSWARQAQEGQFFFRNLFTNELITSQELPLFHHLLSWLIGTLSRLLSISLVESYHLCRVIFAALGFKWFYDLARMATGSEQARLTAISLMAFSTGVGGLLNHWWPINLMDVPGSSMRAEAFTLLSTFAFALNTTSIALLCLIFLWIFKAAKTGQVIYSYGAACAAVLLGNTHPYNNFPLLVVLLLALVDNRILHKQTLNVRPAYLLPVITGAFLSILVQVVVLRLSTDFQLKANFIIPPPHPLSLILTYGPLSILAVLAIWHRRHCTIIRFAAYWLVACSLLIYIPVTWSGKMIEGIHLPLCLLSAIGLVLATQKFSQPIKIIASIVVITIMCVSSARYILWVLNEVRNDRSDIERFVLAPSYLTSGDAAALNYLDQNQSMEPATSEVVLALPLLGNYIPSRTGKFTYIGHLTETYNYSTEAGITGSSGGKLEQTLKFYFLAQSRTKALDWLQANHINYVIEGHYEKYFARKLKVSLPSQRYNLPLIFRHGQTAVYSVPKP